MKNRIVHVSLGCLLLLACMSMFLTLPPSSAQVPNAQVQFENECRELLNQVYLRARGRQILISAYMPSGDPVIDRFVYELRFKFLQDLLSRNPSVCYDLDSLEKLLIGGIKPLPTPVPTPGPNIRMPNSTPTPTPSPTPVPIGTPVDPVSAPPPKETPEERAKRLKKLLEERFPEGDEVEKRVQEIKKKNKASKPRDDIEWEVDEGDSIDGPIGVEIEVPGVGAIKITLPNDIRPGDTITGTVTAEPYGTTEVEREKNKDEVSKYGVEFSPAPPRVDPEPLVPEPGMSGPIVKGKLYFDEEYQPRVFEFSPSIWRTPKLDPADDYKSSAAPTPASPTDIHLSVPDVPAKQYFFTIIVTRDDDNTGIPIDLGQFNFKREQLPRVPEMLTSRLISPYIQTGSPVKITGNFDGIGGNTKLQTGGTNLRIIAESPRSCLFRVPADLIGSVEFTIKENGKEQKLMSRVIGIELSSPKLNLKRGEKTTVAIEVRGLNGLSENEIVPLQLVSSGVVDMKGGNTQSLQIRKKDLDKAGIYRTTRTVTGHSTGGWGIRATVINPHR